MNSQRSLIRLISLLVISAATLTAFAQGPAGGPPPPGGRPMGGPPGPGGGRRGGGRGGPGLLMAPAVQKELKLSGDQVKKIQALVGPGGRPGGPGGPGGPPGGPGGPPPGGPGGRGGQGGAGGRGGGRRAEMEAKVKAILNPSQYQRFREITFQMEGARALGRPEVVKELGLSAAQTAKLEALRPQRGGGRGGGGRPGGPPGGPGGPGGPGPGGPGGPGGRGGFDPAARKKNEAMALSVLTPTQLAHWKKMQGKPFAMPPPPPGGRGR